jgi:transposase
MRIRTAFEIHEGVDELRRLLTKESDGRRKERLHFLYLFQSGQVRYLSQAGALLGRDRKTMSQWRSKYLSGGLSELLERGTSPGRTPQVYGAALARLKKRLGDPEGFGSYKEIGGWVREELGITLKPKTLYHLCHSKLGATSKVARPSNPKKDEDAVAAFKKTLQPNWRP